MAFVIEKIPQEALLSPDNKLVGFNTDLSQEWAIDRDREAFIVLTRKIGGPYGGTQVTKSYTLSWKGELIYIVADPLPKVYTDQGAIMSWRLHRLTLPEGLQHLSNEVFQLIKDAFVAVGECFNGYEYIAVNVEFKLPSSR